MRRREAIASLGSILTVGCLRFTQNSESETTANGTTNPQSVNQDSLSEAETNDSSEITLSTKWNITQILDTPRIVGNYLYGYFNSSVHKIDRTDGSTIWKTEPISSTHFGSIAVDEPYVYGFAGGDPDTDTPPKLCIVNSQSGEIIWQYEGQYSEWPTSNPVDGNESHVAYTQRTGNDSAILRLFKNDQKTPIWEFETDDSLSFINSLSISNNRLYIFGDQIQVRDLPSQSVQRTRQISTPASPLLTNNTIYIPTSDSIISLDNVSLKSNWKFTPQYGGLNVKPELFQDEKNKQYIVTAGKTGIFCLDPSTGSRKWKYDTENSIERAEQIAIAGGTAFVWDDLGFLIGVDIKTGGLKYKSHEKSETASAGLESGETTLYISSGDSSGGDLEKGTTAASLE